MYKVSKNKPKKQLMERIYQQYYYSKKPSSLKYFHVNTLKMYRQGFEKS